MVERLIAQVGYPWTARILGFTVLGTSIVCCLFMIPRIPPRRSGPLVDVPSLTDAPFLIFSFGALSGFLGIYVPLFFIPSYTIHLGYSESTGLYMSSVINAASIAGRILPNLVADRIGPFNTVVPCTFCVVVVIFSWIGVNSLGGIIAFCIFFGFFSGSYVSIPPSCIASITPDLSIMATRMGMSFFISSFGCLAGGPSGGALISKNNGGYLYAQLFAGVATSISFACFLYARYLIKGFELKKC